jgi:hypothetical protein
MNRFSRQGYPILFASFLGSVWLVALLCAGCKTPPCSEQNFAKPFDAPRVAQLSHDCHKVAWEARFCARENLRHLSYRPTILDWEAVYYIDRLLRQAHWIAYDVEKHPATPRCSSKASYDIVAFDARMLKARYSPTSFTPYTDARIEKLIELTDEISSYYQIKPPQEVPSQK